MRRLSIRLRLTLAFAVVMSFGLTAIGLFVYLRFRSDLDSTINQSLQARSRDVAALVRQADDGPSRGGRRLLSQQEEGFAQVLSAGGRVIAATPAVRDLSLIDSSQLARAHRDEVTFDRPPVGGLEEPSRIRASPLRIAGEDLVVVAGVALDDRNDSLASLRDLLLVGGPVALLLACAAGYWVAAAALRPVEAMRRRAPRSPPPSPGGACRSPRAATRSPASGRR